MLTETNEAFSNTKSACLSTGVHGGLPQWLNGKESYNAGDTGSLATASSVLAWEIPWTEEPGGLCACGHKRVGYNLPTKQQQSRPAYSWKATGGIKSEQGQPYPMLKSKEREEKQILGGFPGKESTCQCRRRRRFGFDPWLGKIPWRRKWQLAPILLLEKFHGQEPGRLQSMGPQTVRHD